MTVVATIAVLVIALLHLYFLLLEMVFWTKPRGRKAFNLTPEFALASKSLAANQGLYNGFLAAGLLWGVIEGVSTPMGMALETFFLLCVIVAGLFGAATASRKILWIQGLPALIALILVRLA